MKLNIRLSTREGYRSKPPSIPLKLDEQLSRSGVLETVASFSSFSKESGYVHFDYEWNPYTIGQMRLYEREKG